MNFLMFSAWSFRCQDRSSRRTGEAVFEPQGVDSPGEFASKCVFEGPLTLCLVDGLTNV